MKKMKRALALALALVMSLGVLAGCNSGDKSGAASGSSSSASQQKIEPMDLSKVKDPFEACSGMKPDAVVATVGDLEVTAADFLHWLSYGVDLYMHQLAPYGITEIPWDEEAEEGKTFKQVMMENALESAAFYTLVPEIAKKEGLAMTEEEKKFLEDDIKKTEEELGGHEMLDHVLWMQLTTEEQHRRMYESAKLYEALQNKFFGEGAEKYPSDAQVQEFADKELGAYRAKHILIATKDPATNKEFDEATVKEKKALVDELLAQIRAAEDPAAKFDELMKKHSDDPGLATAPNGYDATKGQMVPEFEKAALALQVGQISDVVKSEFGYHIIMRLPVDLKPLRQELVYRQMEDMSDKWMEEAGVKKTKEFDKIDPVAYTKKADTLKMAVNQELKAIQDKKAAEEAAKPAPQPPEGAQ